ncbi:Caspase domain protein [Rubripirellula tenax]|uniref:Caspase domain protein n=1 Tax=Rubripirellula tenax TaxID=2528015 RepID=A0A5C6F0L4_9BACT|nr:caspase family protein [Rubripirellula tenax]TWU54822.1 Caspase domain protein [Rubripirellula tenax]
MFRFVLFPLIAWIVLSQHQAYAARHALLIGCSDYKTQSDLHGCGVDVALLKERLATPRFGFRPDDLTVLSDADTTTKPPTYSNIHAAFETVVAADWAADEAPDMLLIYMSGHGGQRRSDTEKDGTDEFFMPIDETEVILDDQIGVWLAALNQKGIRTWIVFDSCFSGTMTRGGDPNETVRGLASPELDAIRLAAPKSNDDVGWELPKDGSSNCVAFYACQAYERAIEDKSLDKSAGKPVPHGLFTYCLLQCLDQQSVDDNASLSYEDLRRGIIERYRALGRTWPTPFCEGDLDQEVLGFEKWPRANPMYLQNDGDTASIIGGQMAGLTMNAIVAIFAPQDRKQITPIGYVQVTNLSATTAEINSVAYGDFSEPVPIDDLPKNSTCQVVSQELGELRIALTISASEVDAAQSLEMTIREKAADPLSIFRVVETKGTQGWTLLVSETDRLLVPNEVALTLGDDWPTAAQLQRVPHVRYLSSLANSGLVDAVERDLRRVYNCENLQRLAAAYGPNAAATHDIKLKMTKVTGDLTTDVVKAGDVLRIEVVNEGAYDAAFAVFFVSSRFQIASQASDFIKPAQSLFRPTTIALFEMTINEKMWGQNGLVLVGIPQEGRVKHQLNYVGIEQTKLGDVVAKKRGFVAKTPFEKQLYDATFGNQKFRTGGTTQQPQMSMVSWVVSE